MDERRKRRKRARRLGRLLAEFRADRSAAAGATLAGALIGGGILTYLLIARPDPPKLFWAAVLLCLFGIGAALCMFVLQVCRGPKAVQVYEAGVCVVDGSRQTMLGWENIAAVDAQKTVVRSLTLMGLPTKTEWDVTIHATHGESIRLSPTFLQYVPNVERMVILLRKHTDTEPELY